MDKWTLKFDKNLRRGHSKNIFPQIVRQARGKKTKNNSKNGNNKRKIKNLKPS